MPKVPMIEIDKYELLALQMRVGTREDLAEKLGIAKSVVDRWLSQGRLPVAQLERIKALPAGPDYSPTSSLKSVDMEGPKLFMEQKGESIGSSVLGSFKTEDLIQELSNRGLDVFIKKPARKAKSASK
nr:hypothetical protein HAGR004_01440 [Bdellovibrio sp. HAGR004]